MQRSKVGYEYTRKELIAPVAFLVAVAVIVAVGFGVVVV